VPAAIPAIAAYIAANVTVAAVVGFVAKVAVFALISRALQPKPKRPSAGAEAVRDRSVVVRSTTEPHRIIYGRAIVSGMLAYFETTGASKEYAHMVVVLAGHEVDSIGRVWFDDTDVGALDGSGNVTSGRYSGLARIEKYLGADSQTASATLVAESGGAWTTNDRLRGRAYLYVRLKRDDTAFPTGLPNIRAEVKGRKCYDPRDGGTRWTISPSLIQRDILTASWGLGASSGEIDDALVSAGANVDDERVTVSAYTSPAITPDHTTERLTFASTEIDLGIGDGVHIASTGSLPTGLSASPTKYFVIRISDSVVQLAATYADALAGTAVPFTSNGSGTITLSHVDQVRFTCNGTFTRETDPKEMLEAVSLSHMGPAPIFREGQWRVYAGAWSTSTVTITESDLRGDVTEMVRPTRQNLFNAVRGTYAPAYNSTDSEYFPVTNSTYETQDGGVRIYKDLSFPLVDNTVRAQRLAKLALELARSASTLVLQCKLTVLKVAPWDTVYVTIGTLGMSAATYRVKGWKLTAEDGALGVDLTLQEEAASIYGWTAASATSVPVRPELSIPSAYNIGAPTSLVLTSGTAELLRMADGTITSRIKVSFTGAVEANLWRYELQWKKSAESTYNTVYMPADSTVYYLAPVEDGVTYNVRVRAHSVLGARSTYLVDTHTVVGKTDAPTAPATLGVSPATGGFDISWDICPDADYFGTQIYEASSNDRTTATQIAEVASTRMARSGLAGGLTRYYWIRNVDTTGNVSSWYPVSSTGGVSATTGSAGNTQQITHDSTSYLAGGATGYLTGTGYWLGYNSTAYKMHLGDPSGAYMAWDGSALKVKGSVFAGDITVDTTGNVRGGQTGYNTGTGFFLGYSGGAYKFSIGDPAGEHLLWTGTNLVINGATVSGGQTAYDTGTGFWMGYVGGEWKFSVGDDAGNKLTFDGTSLSATGIGGEDTRTYAAGTKILAGLPRLTRVDNTIDANYTVYKSIRVTRSGTVSAKFTFAITSSGDTIYAKLYKNGTATGTERTSTSLSPSTPATENITVAAGDTIELWAHMQSGNDSIGWLWNFYLMTDDDFTEAAVLDSGELYFWPT